MEFEYNGNIYRITGLFNGKITLELIEVRSTSIYGPTYKNITRKVYFSFKRKERIAYIIDNNQQQIDVNGLIRTFIHTEFHGIV